MKLITHLHLQTLRMRGAIFPVTRKALYLIKHWDKSTLLSIPKILLFLYYGSTAFCWASAAFSVSYSYTQSVGLLGRGISPSQGRYLHTDADIHALSGMRAHDTSVRASEDSSCLRPRGHCDRLHPENITPKLATNSSQYTRHYRTRTCVSSVWSRS
jgi:hypothetical protein